jgi:hypothetical protein
MRIRLAVLCVGMSTSFALAQQTSAPNPAPNPTTSQGQPTENRAIPDKTGKQQPQGQTGPLETVGEGALPENPQGDTPEGMQAHPTKSK